MSANVIKLVLSEYARDQNLYRAIYIPVLAEQAVMNMRSVFSIAAKPIIRRGFQQGR